MKRISVLGSTGSIGTQTLDIVREHSDELSVVSLSCGKNVALLAEQTAEFSPELVCVENESLAEELRGRLEALNVPHMPKIAFGMDGLIEAATVTEAQTVVTAIVGMLGIRPTIAAIEAGKDIALANKETLVCAGSIIMPLAKKCGVKILPVDSEHSAIFQSIQGNEGQVIEKIILTASGGPFRGKSKDEIQNMRAADALKHPNWSMGQKVTIDSSTLANKGLEVMEASWLFGVPIDRIEVTVHPQSILHSAVQYEDGSVVGQMGLPDMHLPIQYALFYPERRQLGQKRLNLFDIMTLTFERPDMETFPALALAIEAGTRGGNLPTVFNAANEVAVARFLKDDIAWAGISEMIEKAMRTVPYASVTCVEDILEAERKTRELLST